MEPSYKTVYLQVQGTTITLISPVPREDCPVALPIVASETPEKLQHLSMGRWAYIGGELVEQEGWDTPVLLPTE